MKPREPDRRARREQNRAAKVAKDRELTELYAQAQKAEADGKAAVAKVYYQMVVSRGDGELKQRAATRLASLGQPSRLP